MDKEIINHKIHWYKHWINPLILLLVATVGWFLRNYDTALSQFLVADGFFIIMIIIAIGACIMKVRQYFNKLGGLIND